MEVLGISHIGIAVKSLEKALWFYRDMLGLRQTADKTIPAYGIRAVFLEKGDLKIELMESISEDGTIARHLTEHGEGVQHIGVRVKDLDAAISEIKAKGGWVVEDTRGEGAFGERVVFLHPITTRGVVMELLEENGS